MDTAERFASDVARAYCSLTGERPDRLARSIEAWQAERGLTTELWAAYVASGLAVRNHRRPTAELRQAVVTAIFAGDWTAPFEDVMQILGEGSIPVRWQTSRHAAAVVEAAALCPPAPAPSGAVEPPAAAPSAGPAPAPAVEAVTPAAPAAGAPPVDHHRPAYPAESSDQRRWAAIAAEGRGLGRRSEAWWRYVEAVRLTLGVPAHAPLTDDRGIA